MKKSTPVPATHSIYQQYLSKNFHYPSTKITKQKENRARDQRSCQKQKALSYSAIDKQVPKKQYHLYPSAQNIQKSYNTNLIPMHCHIATVQQIQSAIKNEPNKNSNDSQNSIQKSPNINQSVVRTELEKSLKQLSAIFSLQLQNDEQKTNRMLDPNNNEHKQKNSDFIINYSNQQASNIIKSVNSKMMIKLTNSKKKIINSISFFEISLNTLNQQKSDMGKSISLNINEQGIFCVEELIKAKNGKQIVELLKQSAKLNIEFLNKANKILQQMIQHAVNTQFIQSNLNSVKKRFQKQEIDLNFILKDIQIKQDKIIKIVLQSMGSLNNLQSNSKQNFSMTAYKVWKKALKKGIDLSIQSCSTITNWLKWQKKIYELASLASWSPITFHASQKINQPNQNKLLNSENIDQLLFSQQKVVDKRNKKINEQKNQTKENCYKSTPARQSRRKEQRASQYTNKSQETPCHFCMVLKNRIFQLEENAKNDSQIQIQQQSIIRRLKLQLQKMQRVFTLWSKTAGVQCNIIKFIENYDLRDEFDRVNETRKDKKCLGSFYQNILLQQAKGIQTLIKGQVYLDGSMKQSLNSHSIEIQAVDTQPLARELKPTNLTIAKNTNKKITYFSGSFDRKNSKDINDKMNSLQSQVKNNNKENSNESKSIMDNQKYLKKNNGTTVPNSRQNSSFLTRNILFNQNPSDQSDSNLLSYSPDVQPTSNKLRLPDRRITQEILDYDISEFQVQRQIPKQNNHNDYEANYQKIKTIKQQIEENSCKEMQENYIEKEFNMILFNKKNEQNIKYKIQEELKKKLNQGQLTLKIGQQYQHFIDYHLRTQLQRVKQQKKKSTKHKRFVSQTEISRRYMSLDKIRTTHKAFRGNDSLQVTYQTNPKHKSQSAPKFIHLKH